MRKALLRPPFGGQDYGLRTEKKLITQRRPKAGKKIDEQIYCRPKAGTKEC
jgi:hypothetical protein